MNASFPTPKNFGKTDSTEPSYHDKLSRSELREAIRDYSKWAVEKYDAYDGINLDELEIGISEKYKRAAAKTGGRRVAGEIASLHMKFAWKAYQKWGWSEDFKNTIRHELIHVWQFQVENDGNHGLSFKLMADRVDAPRHCPQFAEYKYELSCSKCDKFVGGRYKRSKIVKQPKRYRSKCCDAPLQVEKT